MDELVGEFNAELPEAFELLQQYYVELAKKLNDDVRQMREDTATDKNKRYAFDCAWRLIVNNQNTYHKLIKQENGDDVALKPDYRGPEKVYFHDVYTELLKMLEQLHAPPYGVKMLMQRIENTLGRCAVCHRDITRRPIPKCICKSRSYCSPGHMQQDAEEHARICPHKLKREEDERIRIEKEKQAEKQIKKHEEAKRVEAAKREAALRSKVAGPDTEPEEPLDAESEAIKQSLQKMVV